MNEVTVALAAVAVLVILVFARWWASRRADDLERAFRHREHYFGAAEQLVSDQRTPELVVRLVLNAAEGIASRRVNGRLVRHLALRRFGIKAPSHPLVKSAIAAASQMPCDLRMTFLRSNLDLMASVTYQSTVLGPWIRREFKNLAKSSRPDDNGKRDGKAEVLLFVDAAVPRFQAEAQAA